jgi:hypothetical protein
MTMSHSATIGAEAHAAPRAKARNLSLDRARTFLTLVVLLHHAVIPYTYFGHTDPASWAGFDVVVLATDSFFMAMFFFLSGLFTWPGIARKAPSVFLRDRLLRLGLPFAIAAFTVIPLAYYAIALRHDPGLSFTAIWFVWVLLAFDLTASLLYRVSAHLVDPGNRVSLRGFDQPAVFWLLLVVVTAIAYVPALLYFGGSKWFELGPFSVQASRILLYFAYFFIGVSVGAANFDRGILSAGGQLPKQRWLWVIATLISYCLMWGMIYIKREILGNPDPQPHWYQAIYGTFFVLFSGSILLAILAFFLHQKSPGPNLLDRMQADAYGIFLVHYPIALWIQYALFDYSLPAIVKATIGFVLTVILSWGLTAALRKIPGASHVL